MKQLAEWIVDRLDCEDAQQREIAVYGMECLIADAVQIALLLLAAFLCGVEVLWFSAAFTTLKKDVGGWHAPNHFWCISGFTAMAAIAAMGSRAVSDRLVLPAGLLCWMVATIIVVWLKPLAHRNHPKSKQAHAKSRRKSHIKLAVMGVVLLLGFLLVPSRRSYWLAVGFGGAAAAVTLWAGWLERRRKDGCEEMETSGFESR